MRFIHNDGLASKKIRTEEFPAALQPGESLANAFGTCLCPTSNSQTKAKARAKPTHNEFISLNWDRKN